MAELELSHANALETTGRDLRHGFTALQEGVVGAGDLKVTPGAAGLVVDVAAGVGYIQGDAATDQGLYRVRNDAAKASSAFALGGIPAANGANPRIDQIIARAYDTDEDNSGSRLWRLEVLAGAATAGATLDNRTGAAALPAGAMLLADVLTPAAFSGPYVAATHIRDRRPWARGAYSRSVVSAGADYSITATALTAIDSTNLSRRIECSGKPLRVTFDAIFTESAANVWYLLTPRVDGVAPLGTVQGVHTGPNAAGGFHLLHAEWELLPAAGSHVIDIAAATQSGTLTIQRGTDYWPQFIIEEILRESAHNG